MVSAILKVSGELRSGMAAGEMRMSIELSRISCSLKVSGVHRSGMSAGEVSNLKDAGASCSLMAMS